MKILIIAPYGIGNLIMLHPLLVALKSRGIAFDIVSFLKSVDVMLTTWSEFSSLYEKRWFVGGSKATVAKTFMAIRAEHYDASVLSFPSARFHYNAFSFACGAKNRAAAKYPDDGFDSLSFLNNRLVPLEVGLHDALQNARIAQAAGIAIDKRDIAAFTAKNDGIPVIGIHPGCKKSESFKRWNLDRWNSLIERLSTAYPSHEIRAYFGPDEEEERIFLSTIPNLVVKTNVSLSRLHTDIGECGLFISNDSGLMHTAVFAGVRTVAIIGPSDERRTGPFTNDTEILSAPCPIKPCSHSFNRATHAFNCPHARQCMEGVTVEMVFDAAARALSKKAL